MNIETKYWYLHNHQLFDELSRNEINEIGYLSHFRTGLRGQIIDLSPNEDRVFTLKAGMLKIVDVDADGNQQLIEVLRPGDLFGQFTLTRHTSSQYAVVLSDNVIFCSFLVSDFEQIMKRYPSLGVRFTKLVGLHFKRLKNSYANLMYKDVRTRLRLFLKDWLEKDAKPGRPNVLNNYLSHKDISQIICSNRQTVTELFNEFRQAGMLEYDRSQIKITNPALLDV
ncbi:Crp/Fnr family transcriptional regulator [Spirosoma arcticum]